MIFLSCPFDFSTDDFGHSCFVPQNPNHGTAFDQVLVHHAVNCCVPPEKP